MFARVDTECDEIESFLPSRQGSSVVEQGTHKPLVGSSNLPPGTLLNGLGLHSAWVERLPLHWILYGISTPASHNISAVTQQLQSIRSETSDCGKKRSSGVGRGSANPNEH